MAMEVITTSLGICSVPIINECIVTPLKNHICYAFTLDSKLQRLSEQILVLQVKIREIQESVREARRKGEQIDEKVSMWLSSAEKVIVEAAELIRGKEEAKKKCCVGFCPNLKTRCQLSKKAHKKALAIDEQLKNAQGLNPIAFPLPLKQIVGPSVYSHEALASRVRILKEIMDALKYPNLKMIGVHGMGGVGKTTLVKEVQGQALKEKLFETVVKVPVSQKPDLKKIQGEIAGFLNLQLNSEEISVRASELHRRLENDKVLIILDDVWQQLDLNELGIPSGMHLKVAKFC